MLCSLKSQNWMVVDALTNKAVILLQSLFENVKIQIWNLPLSKFTKPIANSWAACSIASYQTFLC